jgi:hypothetical protein
MRPREARERDLAIMKPVVMSLLLALTACTPVDGNPLIAATDDQFLKVMGNLGFYGCDGVLFAAKGASGDQAARQTCEQGIKKRAADVGITQAVTPGDIADARVRERYQKLVKR